MPNPLLELEGTVEEIQQRLTDFAGQRLHVTVRPAEIVDQPRMTLEEKILARATQAPPEERAKIPPDLTSNLDHYVYGTQDK